MVSWNAIPSSSYESIKCADTGMSALVVSGTGLFACQLAKKIFHAGKVITTVSTGKKSKVNELLGDNVVDESESDPCSAIPSYRRTGGESSISHLNQSSTIRPPIPKPSSLSNQ